MYDNGYSKNISSCHKGNSPCLELAAAGLAGDLGLEACQPEPLPVKDASGLPTGPNTEVGESLSSSALFPHFLGYTRRSGRSGENCTFSRLATNCN